MASNNCEAVSLFSPRRFDRRSHLSLTASGFKGCRNIGVWQACMCPPAVLWDGRKMTCPQQHVIWQTSLIARYGQLFIDEGSASASSGGLGSPLSTFHGPGPLKKRAAAVPPFPNSLASSASESSEVRFVENAGRLHFSTAPAGRGGQRLREKQTWWR